MQALVSKAEYALAQGRINFALRIVHNFVEKIITEPICAAQVFDSRDLDQLCILIGRKNLENLNQSEDDWWHLFRSEGAVVIYVVSRLQRSGGHSRLVQDFIRAQPESNHLILSTEIGGFSDRSYFAKIFSANDNVKFLYARRADFQSKLTWLQSILMVVRPVHVHLFNHHQDSTAVAALAPEIGLKGSFYHHGDHHLCLGVHLDHFAHVNLHPMGYHYCRDELGIDNKYLPLTFEDKGCASVRDGVLSGRGLITATAARSNKVEIPYFVSYVDAVALIIEATGGWHVHIGKLTPWALRQIYGQMKVRGIPRDRFIYIEWVESVWKSLREYDVDVYVASFPYGAGLTLIEAMGAGIPVIMHKHLYSRVLSGLELAYPEAFCWGDLDDLLTHLAALRSDRVANEGKLSRLQYERFHRPEILQNYLRDPASFGLSVPSLRSEFKPRRDEWAAWIETQLTIYRFVYRFIYRTLRKLRRLMS